MKNIPEGRSAQCDLTPMMTDLGSEELEIGRGDGIVVLIGFEEKGGVSIGIVEASTENEYPD